MNHFYVPLLLFLLCKIYLTKGVNLNRERISSFLNYKLNLINIKKRQSSLFCYKKRVKAKELRKLTTEELEKEIIKCRLDIQKFQHQGFYDIHNFKIQYEKNAKRKLAQLLTIYYERYLDNNIRIKS
ncbi:50S ribosomal protein L29, putative [Plasmodium malariae]|uniref:50S ribosomal protein L29, putative n=1 Tax=Plasmodium malariae TaxID=5858 RepID=A0A1D3TCF6_PLAMA|nr:50S ribosomal protein L29, putative [Plasmodium malariae]SCP02532.1 50S ribosomal protein L29, putative [Plasmodium malariae]